MIIEELSPHIRGDFTAILERVTIPCAFYDAQESEEPTIEEPNRMRAVRFDTYGMQLDETEELVQLQQNI